jgi:hypothetical protein
LTAYFLEKGDAMMDHGRLEVQIYQIADDAMLKQNRSDGTGWEWGWADWQRDWMSETPHRYAYRCLPLTIANQTGWWIRNPVGFTATWRGLNAPGNIDFRFDASGHIWKDWINSQFGEGIITWNTPFLFRTRPEGSRLLICGPINSFKLNAHPLTALIESDWISMSFTMNWKIMLPNQPVRFDQGEPLFQAIPLANNICADLESADVSYQKLADDPELYRAYSEWDQGRRRFHDQKAAGEVKPTDWQKDYFQGRDAVGRESGAHHTTKVKPPVVRGAQGMTSDSPARVYPERGLAETHRGRPSSTGAPLDPSVEDRLEWIYSQGNVVIAMMEQAPDPADRSDHPWPGTRTDNPPGQRETT